MLLQRLPDHADLLLSALRGPRAVSEFSNAEWDITIRLARSSKLLARLAVCLEEVGSTDRLPKIAINNLKGARVKVEALQRLALWEINRLQAVLKDLEIPVVVLKGCAYILEGLPAARGRLLSDVDILVERDKLEAVEATLLKAGWQSAEMDEYDQHYYRTWTHEIPPLRHRDRQIEVDVHHTILALTSRLKPNPRHLMAAAQQLPDSMFKVLAPCDMILHSATHLFYDAELNGQLRDVVDLDDLFRHFAADDRRFWQQLLERAETLDLQRPIFYAIRYSHLFLNTPVPPEVWKQLELIKPSGLALFLMDRLVPLAMLPEHPDHPRFNVAVARWCLYVRSHYLRMPLRMLIPHLVRKSLKRNQLIPRTG